MVRLSIHPLFCANIKNVNACLLLFISFKQLVYCVCFITAQFTLLSGKEIEQHDDQTYGSLTVHNISQCAQMCVESATFTCESFDFCPMDPAGVCRLSQSHVGRGGIVVKDSTCDHFSREFRPPFICFSETIFQCVRV